MLLQTPGQTLNWSFVQVPLVWICLSRKELITGPVPGTLRMRLRNVVIHPTDVWKMLFLYEQHQVSVLGLRQMYDWTSSAFAGCGFAERKYKLFFLETGRIWCFLLFVYKTNLRSAIYKLVLLLMLYVLWTLLALLEALLGKLEDLGVGLAVIRRVRWECPAAGLYPGVCHLCVATFCVCTGDRVLE